MVKKQESWWDKQFGEFTTVGQWLFLVAVVCSLFLLMWVREYNFQLAECQDDLELIGPDYIEHTRCLLPMHEGEIVIRTETEDFEFDLQCAKFQVFDIRQPQPEEEMREAVVDGCRRHLLTPEFCLCYLFNEKCNEVQKVLYNDYVECKGDRCSVGLGGLVADINKAMYEYLCNQPKAEQPRECVEWAHYPLFVCGEEVANNGFCCLRERTIETETNRCLERGGEIVNCAEFCARYNGCVCWSDEPCASEGS